MSHRRTASRLAGQARGMMPWTEDRDKRLRASGAGMAPSPILGRDKGLEAVADLIGPEALEPAQHAVHHLKLFLGGHTDLDDGADVPLIERIDQ